MFIIALSNIPHIPYVHASVTYYDVTLTYDFDNNSLSGWLGNQAVVTSADHHSGSYCVDQHTWTAYSSNITAVWGTTFAGQLLAQYMIYHNFTFPDNVIEANISFWHREYDSSYNPTICYDGYKIGSSSNVLWGQTKTSKSIVTTWQQSEVFDMTSYINNGGTTGIVNRIKVASVGYFTVIPGYTMSYYIDDIVINYTYYVNNPVVLELDPMYTQWIGTGLFLSGFIMFGVPIIVISYKARERDLSIRTLILLLTVVLIGFFLLISIGDLI